MSSFLPFITALAAIQFSSVLSIRNEEFNLPNDKEWMSLTPVVDFIPAANHDNNPLLRRAHARLLNYYKDEFVDGLETQYNDYAEAWRYLGLFEDCSYNAQNNKLRRLDQNAGEEAGDDAQGDDAVVEQEEVVDDGSICKRYLLWAAVSEMRIHRVSSIIYV
jgi:hypothetical protein